MNEVSLVNSQFAEVFRISSIGGLIATVTLLININFKVFKTIFKDNARSYWWLFVGISVVPLLLFLYIFNLIFGRLF